MQKPPVTFSTWPVMQLTIGEQETAPLHISDAFTQSPGRDLFFKILSDFGHAFAQADIDEAGATAFTVLCWIGNSRAKRRPGRCAVESNFRLSGHILFERWPVCSLFRALPSKEFFNQPPFSTTP